jgi:hypothetical protein
MSHTHFVLDVPTLLHDRLIEALDRWLRRRTRGRGREAAGELIVAIWTANHLQRNCAAEERGPLDGAYRPRRRSANREFQPANQG